MDPNSNLNPAGFAVLLDRSLVIEQIASLVGSTPVRARPLGGGDIAASYRVDLDDGRRVFAKTFAGAPPLFFDTEARGLAWLRDAGALAVPKVLAVSDDPGLLVLEWVDASHNISPDEAAFGRGLAELHRSGATCFGREDRRTTGSRRLPNHPCESWSEFYASQRLVPLVRLAVDTGTFTMTEVMVFESIAERLNDVGGDAALEPPARLHGDLWAGNRIVDVEGRSWLIDPACHGGHREFDLAMMRLFGGFGDAAFRSYEDVFPLGGGWADRVELHQLAPLLVHAIKFGGGYQSAALAAAERYR